jgi:signal transduction histidine kinase
MATYTPNSILIVDDTPNNIRVLLNVLSESGFDVSVATSGEMALDKIPIIQPDLILLDVMMPGIDGFSTCQQLKANSITSNIPIIFMTALADTQDKVKGLRCGAVDYITKPIQVEEAVARIQIHLNLRQTQLQLQQTVQDLRTAQTQMIQAEKMSSLGQLVAGIAHEINNPINFIYGNLTHAQDYIQVLFKVINQQRHERTVPEEEEDVDVEFIAQDLPKLIESMQAGVRRIREIVLALRIFSRLDEAIVKSVNIHEGIDSTLMILQHRLKAKPNCPVIEVVKDYADLPLVECYAGQLNQVFMNLLSNAIDALEEGIATQTVGSPCIKICTRMMETNFLQVRISDNGSGISPDIQSRIFDPFFTTKPVGVGTGMGLAISYQIITERHRGSLECVSLPEQGTEFIITIPFHQQSQ